MANLKQIEKYLKNKNLPFKVVDLGREIFTVAGVKESGINEDDIVKTLIVRSNNGFIALALCGNDRIDFKKVRRLFSPSTSLRPSALRSLTVRFRPNRLRLEEVNCELAKPEEVLKVAGVPVGAVCPILLKIPIYIDNRVLNLKHVHMGSGDLTCGLEMKLKDLLSAIGDYQVEEFALA